MLDRMVGQERIADEIKIVLKPYYQKAQINKDEYKLIMKNCVTKVSDSCPSLHYTNAIWCELHVIADLIVCLEWSKMRFDFKFGFNM